MAKKFLRILCSPIDNADLNFTLDTPGHFRLQSFERVLKDIYAID